MPLREDLLAPIAGENPSGEDLYYDKVFAQIKEARKEDAERSAGRRLGGFPEEESRPSSSHQNGRRSAGQEEQGSSAGILLVESQLRVEGLSILSPGIELLRSIQEAFWPTFYPPIEEGNDLEMRMLNGGRSGRADRCRRSQGANH